MISFLIDEMFPPATAEQLRDVHDMDAVHVSAIGLRAIEDERIAAFARAGGRAFVTENVADFADEPDVVLIFVLKRNLPSGGAQAHALATHLVAWADANPDPYVGHHWPPTS